MIPGNASLRRRSIKPMARCVMSIPIQARRGAPVLRGSNRKKAGRSAILPARRVIASTRKAVRQSPITVRLGTDSANPFRQQIYKSLVSVALRPQTAKPPANEKTGGFAFSPYAPASSAAQKGIVGAVEPEWQQQERRTSSLERLRRGTSRSDQIKYTHSDRAIFDICHVRNAAQKGSQGR